MRIAVFPGSFDPFTIGHADIVRRGLQLFDRIVVAVGYNVQKTTGTSVAERVAAIERWAATLPDLTLHLPESAAPSSCTVNNAAIQSPRIKVVSYSCLTVDLAAQEGAQAILRGVRSVKDFEYERDLAALNAVTPSVRGAEGVETVLLIADPRYAHISSSVVRELQAYGRDVTPYLP